MLRTALTTLAATALTALAPAQLASFTTYGSSCGLPGAPPPLIQAVTMPQLGSTFTVRHISLPSGQTPVSIDQPALIMGFQQTAIPMPVLSSMQPAGCSILTSSLVVAIMPWNGSSYPNTFSMQIPNVSSLMGVTFHQQWLSLYSRCTGVCTPRMVRATNAGTAVIGL